jgi:guanylate kinase
MNQVNLKYYQEFKDTLRSYHISDESKESLKGLKLVLLIAPTSAGRNTIIRHLVTTGKYHYIVSDTTRQPRINDGVVEQNGKEYWFRTEEEMLADLKAGLFLEAELIHNQQVSGISIRELEKAKNEQKVAVTDVDLQGVHNMIKVKPDTFAIMVIPPSFHEWQDRIVRRSLMSEPELSRRFETAYRIFSDGLQNHFYHFVISENVEQSASIIDSIVAGGMNPHQDRGRELLHNLQHQLDQKLGR